MAVVAVCGLSVKGGYSGSTLVAILVVDVCGHPFCWGWLQWQYSSSHGAGGNNLDVYQTIENVFRI